MSPARSAILLVLLPILAACPSPDSNGKVTEPAEAPAIEISGAPLQFTIQAGSPAQSQSVSVRNAGGGNLAWSAASSAAWVALSPPSGSLTKGSSGVITVTLNPSGLAPGTYDATITVSASQASNGSQTAKVTLVVTAPPALSVADTPLSFTAEAGTNPPAVMVAIGNAGGGLLNWTASEDLSWLTVGPTAGTLSAAQNASFAVTVVTAGMGPGTYTGNITISAPGAVNAPRTIPVTLTITPAPAIGVSAPSLNFTAQQGTNPLAQPLTVTNTGGGTLNWTASEPLTWLVGSPASGALSAGESAAISLSVNTTGLHVGTYSGIVTISAPSATTAPQTVTVHLVVTQAPALTVSPTSLSFTAQKGSNPTGQNLTIRNTGGGTLAWTASEPITWLVGTPGTGTLNAGGSETISFAVNTANLDAGTYKGAVTVTAPEAENSPRSIPVTLTITPAPAVLAVGPASLSFSAQQGSSSTSQGVTVSNTGEEELSWSAGDVPSWLNMPITSGVIPGGSSVTISVSANAAGLSAASHTGAITFSAPGAMNSPRSIPVSVAVTAAPALAVTPSALAFSAQVGSTPATQTITIRNSGGGELAWTAGESLGWLNLSSTGGTLAAGASASITATVNTAGLTANTYAGSINVAAAGAAGSPKSVSVTLSLGSAMLAAPTLTSPAGGATGVSRTPTLSWNAVSGANRYWVTIATTQGALPTDPSASACTNCVFSSNTTSNSITVSTTLAAGTTYYWRVQGYNNSTSPTTQGQFSAIRNFTTTSPTTPPPSAPVLRVDGSTESTKAIGQTFSLTGSGFTPNSSATRHLREPNGTVTNIGAVSVSGTGTIAWSFTPVCATPLGTHTLWVVDNTTSARSNDVRETITSSPACTNLLPAPTLNSPANGSSGISTTPTLSWSPVAGANRYWLTVATDPAVLPTDPNATTCSACIVSGNTSSTSHTLPNAFLTGRTATLTSNTTYHWKVQGWNTDGRQGQYSATSQFTTAGVLARGDDYPYKNDPQTFVPNGCSADPWSFCKRNCTSFVAWRVRQVNGIPFNNFYGGPSRSTGGPRWSHAMYWANVARDLGFSVNSTPVVGAVAQWNSSSTTPFGHVAWVSIVHGDGTITIEEYNRDNRGNYSSRRINARIVNNFIHLR